MGNIENAETESVIPVQQQASEPHKTILLQESYQKVLIPDISDRAISKMFSRRQAFSESKYVTIHTFLGEPEFIRNHNFSEERIAVELDNLRNLLATKKIFLRNFTKVPASELYRFVTQELFRMPTSGYILYDSQELVYEEFHGNDEYRIRKLVSIFFEQLLESKWGDPSITSWKNSLINYKSLKGWLRNFSEFDEVLVEMLKIDFTGNSATLTFNASFVAIHIDQFFVTKYHGEGNCKLEKHGGQWSLVEVKLPDVEK